MGDSPFSGCAVLLHEWKATEVHRKYWDKHTTACHFYRTEYLRTICLLSFVQRYLMIYENRIKPELIQKAIAQFGGLPDIYIITPFTSVKRSLA